LAAVHALSWLFQACAGFLLLKGYFTGSWDRFSEKTLSSYLKEGIVLNISIVFMTWLMRGPVLMFRHYEGAENELGQLTLVMQLFTILSGLVLSAAMASQPILSRSVAREDGKDRVYTYWVVRIAILMGTALGCSGLGLGEWFIAAVFGDRYLLAGRLLALSLWMLVPWILGMMLWRVFVAHKKVLWPSLAVASGAICTTVCFKWMLSEWGASGAIFSAGIGMFVWAVMLIADLIRSDRIGLGRILFKTCVVALLSFAAYSALIPLNAWIAVIASWIVLFGGIYLFDVVSRQERLLILGFFRRP
jgi:hypothetical protein